MPTGKNPSSNEVYGLPPREHPVDEELKGHDATSPGAMGDPFDEVPKETFNEIIATGAETIVNSTRITGDEAEESSDNITNNTLGVGRTNDIHQALDDAVEATFDTAMSIISSPSLLNHPEDGQLVQYMQPSKTLEESISEMSDMASNAASEGVSESDSDENTITEPHEGPATTAVHNSMLDSAMGGFRRVEAMLRSSMQVFRRRPSVKISWNCVSLYRLPAPLIALLV